MFFLVYVFISVRHEDIPIVSWMSLNWLLYLKEGKTRFLEGLQHHLTRYLLLPKIAGGGFSYLIEALSAKDVSSGVIFTTRKLVRFIRHAQCHNVCVGNAPTHSDRTITQRNPSITR